MYLKIMNNNCIIMAHPYTFEKLSVRFVGELFFNCPGFLWFIDSFKQWRPTIFQQVGRDEYLRNSQTHSLRSCKNKNSFL